MQHVSSGKFFLVLSFLGFLILVGCAQNDNEASKSTAPLVDSNLLRRWTLESIETAESARIEARDRPYTVTFTADPISPELRLPPAVSGLKGKGLSLGASNGCNFLGEEYEIGAEGSLSIILTLTTLIACLQPPLLEQRFPELLQMAVSYEVQGDILCITAIDSRSGARSVLTLSVTPLAVTSMPARCS